MRKKTFSLPLSYCCCHCISCLLFLFLFLSSFFFLPLPPSFSLHRFQSLLFFILSNFSSPFLLDLKEGEKEKENCSRRCQKGRKYQGEGEREKKYQTESEKGNQRERERELIGNSREGKFSGFPSIQFSIKIKVVSFSLEEK